MQLAAGNDPFRESRTPLDSIIDKLLTFILLLFNARVFGRHGTVRVVRGMVAMSCEGYKTALEGKWLCIV